LAPFDEVVIRMTLGAIAQSHLTIHFEYWRGSQLVATGSQQIACMRREKGEMTPASIPAELRRALTAPLSVE
jgi:enediyne biosynthesis thioesterase